MRGQLRGGATRAVAVEERRDVAGRVGHNFHHPSRSSRKGRCVCGYGTRTSVSGSSSEKKRPTRFHGFLFLGRVCISQIQTLFALTRLTLFRFNRRVGRNERVTAGGGSVGTSFGSTEIAFEKRSYDVLSHSAAHGPRCARQWRRLRMWDWWAWIRTVAEVQTRHRDVFGVPLFHENASLVG